MGRPKNEQPKYLLHKPSGQARVRIDGTDYYLGPHGSPESWSEYYSKLAEFKAGKTPTKTPKADRRGPDSRMPVAEFIARHAAWVLDYYGDKSSQFYRVRSAVAPLLELYGRLPLDQFSPLRLQEVVERLVANGDQRKEVRKNGFKPLSRGRVNRCLNELKSIFRWGVSQELYAAEKYQALESVQNIQRGLGALARKVREMPDVRPAPLAHVAAVLPLVQPEIAAMIRLQLLSGMRPGEVTIMRPADIDHTDWERLTGSDWSLITAEEWSALTGDSIPADADLTAAEVQQRLLATGETKILQQPIWVYTPTKHKNDWREGRRKKRVFLGPKAQAILTPWLADCSSEDFLFSPRKVAARMTESRRKDEPGRKGARSRNYERLTKIKPPRAHYDYASYGQAIERACRKSELPPWSPNQLRHASATFLRAKKGAEASQLALGHKHLNTTEIYAERDFALYAQIMAQYG